MLSAPNGNSLCPPPIPCQVISAAFFRSAHPRSQWTCQPVKSAPPSHPEAYNISNLNLTSYCLWLIEVLVNDGSKPILGRRPAPGPQMVPTSSRSCLLHSLIR